MKEEELNRVIVIDDSFDNNDLFNYLFSKTHEYTYEASIGKEVNHLQRYLFWKSIRTFIEFKHLEIMKDKREYLRTRLLSGNMYEFACHQEMKFQKIDL